ncbi:uncharacterized protein LOC110721811 [Chenopodium quinoa]|uniref:uncharacterized protein LOC110721811 n=1 Tax=Chenopodium quinoa TaxID=63459 RepID=UPI000B777EEC|nr:uncharacterized protein LOC110721811 [Chenopodium quinoa]
MRVGAVCEHKDKGCPWRILASWDKNKTKFCVKSYVGEHTCGRSSKVKKMSASWIAKQYNTQFKVNPYMRLHDLMETVWLDWGIRISRYLAHRARRIGQSLIVDEYKEQYGLLPRYAAEILRSNRGNTVKLKLNGTGPYGGQLLVAVGSDGNNQMFPLAWAVVGVESTETLSWFLHLLAADLGTEEGAGYKFMLDQQKGLLAAIAEVFPQAESRVCSRHVYYNFRGVFGGSLEFRKQFWIIAKSITENDFLAKLQVMRDLSNDAAEDLLKRNYKKWCRAFYTPMSCCDNVDNNMSEVFNAYILKWRHKPIINMLEDIRESLMDKLHKKRDMIKERDLSLCPRIQQQLEKHNMDRTCSCNAWQVSGIPCKHAVVAIWNKVDQPEQYVNDFFKKHTYAKAFDHLLEPLNGPQEWLTSENIVTAPELKKVHNRPKTKRRASAGEVTESGKLKKKGGKITCSLCGVPGHNKALCRNAQRDSFNSTNTASAHTIEPTEATLTVPMHNRDVGVYTYPNGYQRQTTPINQPNPTTFRRGAAFYSNYAREQTIYSFSQEYTMS